MTDTVDYQSTIQSIQYHVDRAEQMPRDEMEKELKILFDEIIDTYKDFPGMQCILLSMSLGDIRHMESGESNYAFDLWSKWVYECRLSPSDLSREEIGKASKIVYGREDAFVY